MNSAFLSQTPDRLEQAYADTHPFILEPRDNTESQDWGILKYALHYVQQHPDCLVHPIRSFGVSRAQDINAWPADTLVKTYKIDNQCGHVLVPGRNSLVEFRLQESSRTVIIINYMEQTPVGTNYNVSKYYSSCVRFQTQEDLKTVVHQTYAYLQQLEEQSLQRTFRVYSQTKNGWEYKTIEDSQTLDQIFVHKTIKDSIVDQLRIFDEEKERAKRFGKPYKLNFLFYGVPGAGKTSLVKAIAKQLKRRLYILNFSKELTDNHLNELLDAIYKDSVLVLEDVDAFFDGRKSEGCNVSFSSLINHLDGIKNSDRGLITILTANHVDKLDPALLRAGRIDQIIKFDYPTRGEVRMAFDAYLDHLNSTEREALFNEWYPLVKNRNIPMSAFTDLFYRHYRTLMAKTPEFLKEHEHLKAITSNPNNDKMYL